MIYGRRRTAGSGEYKTARDFYAAAAGDAGLRRNLFALCAGHQDQENWRRETTRRGGVPGSLRRDPRKKIASLAAEHIGEMRRSAMMVVRNVADAEDAAQEALVSMLRARKAFVPGTATVKTWAKTCAYSRAQNLLRNRRTVEVSLEAADGSAA